MKKLLFLLLAIYIPLQTNQLLESTDERISYVCAVCQENISRAEASLSLLMAIYGEDPTFICDACRKKYKGKKGDQFKEDTLKETIGYRPQLAIVSVQELDSGERTAFRRSPWVQDILLNQYHKNNRLAVVTPSGYRIVAQRKGKHPLFFVQAPRSSGYKLCKLPTVFYDDEESGEKVTVTLPIEEMTPLATNKILITATFGSDESSLFYLYDPRANKFHRLRDGELLAEMEACDKALKDKEILNEFFKDLIEKQKAKEVAKKQALKEEKKQKNTEVLDKFFDDLFANK